MIMLETLSRLYQTMDDSWNAIASLYQFQCNGCEDNCCQSLFFHHTRIEKAYLLYGFNQLLPDHQKAILNMAINYCKKSFPPNGPIQNQNIMCPANENGRCRLYRYRPMICRLHGLPHEVRKPGLSSAMGKGCNAGQFDDKPYIKFDRTPFYRQMAQIEADFQQKTKKTGRIKESIAQMLIFP